MAPICRLKGTATPPDPTLVPTPRPRPQPTPRPPTDGTAKYEKLDFGSEACPAGLEIESEGECSEAIASLGVTDGGSPWTGSRTTMPKFCSLQKATDSMVFNLGPGGSGRHDLAPICRTATLPEPTPAPRPPTDGTAKYEKLDFGAEACPAGLEIESEGECSEAIASLGVTDGGSPCT